MWPFSKRVPTPTSGGDSVYAAYIKSLLDQEQNRKSVLEAKASAIVTTSGAIVTLLFGLVAVVTGAKHFKLPEISRDWLIAAVILFVIAIGLSVATAIIPVPYGGATFEADQLRKVWNQPASAAMANVAEAQLELIPIAVRNNDLKVKFLISAVVGELLALSALAVAIILILA